MKSLVSSIALIFSCLFINAGFAAPLIGNYTINSAQPTGGTNFISFGAFADSINLNGIAGSVVVTVVPGSGPYQEQVVINTVAGASATSTVTLDGSFETLVGVTDSSNRHTFRLQDVQYFDLTNLHIVRDTSSTHAFYGVHILNSGSHIHITNCSVDMSGTTSTLNGAFVASGSVSSILAAGDYHDITFQNDTAIGGGYGVSVYGLSASVLSTGITISYNTFFDFHSNGIYLRETDSTVVSENFFDKRTSNVTSDNAIQVAQANNINTNIYNNFIKMSQTSNGTMTFRGIYLFNGTGHKVYNNVIYDVNLVSGNFTAIDVRTGGTAPEIYFNTISLDNPAASTGDLIGFEESLSNTNSILRNNLISISQPTTGMKAGIAIGAVATVATAVNSDHNIIWTPNGNAAIKNSLTPVLYPTLANWQAASGQDAASFAVDPGFISLTNPVPTSLAADNGGITIPFVANDVMGNLRSIPPDIGAYEYLADEIKEAKAEGNLFLFPNPAKENVFVSLPENISNVSSVSIYNMNGQKLSLSGDPVVVDGNLSVNINELPGGVYLLMVQSGGRALYGRFVK